MDILILMYLFYNYNIMIKAAIDRVYRKITWESVLQDTWKLEAKWNVVSLDEYRKRAQWVLLLEVNPEVKFISWEVVEHLINWEKWEINQQITQKNWLDIVNLIPSIVKKVVDIIDKKYENLKEELTKSKEKNILDKLTINAFNDRSEWNVSWVAIIEDIEKGTFIEFTDFVEEVVRDALVFAWPKAWKPLNMALKRWFTSLHDFHDEMIWKAWTQRAKESLFKLKPWSKHKNAILKIPLANWEIKYVRTITEVVKVWERVFYITKFVDKTPEALEVKHLDSETSNLNSRVDSTLEFLKIMLHIELKVQELIKIVALSLKERWETTQAISDIELRVDIQKKWVSEMSKTSSDIGDLATKLKTLALNALIEAARSGDSWAWFKVVAAETKEIADLSQKMASSITKRASTLNIDTQNIVDNVDWIKWINADRTIIDGLEDISREFGKIIQSYSNLPWITEDLRKTNKWLREQYNKKDILSWKEKFMLDLNLAKIDYKTLVADLMIQVITWSSLKDSTTIWTILSDDFTKFIERSLNAKWGLNNSNYKNFISLNTQIRELTSQILRHIKDLNSWKSNKLTLNEVYDIIETKLSPMVSNILHVINDLLKEIDSNYSEKLVKI
jgi:hypothetical protein